MKSGGLTCYNIKLRESNMTTYKEVKLLKDTEAAYIAGLIDGEGTITLSRRHRNENRQLVISISNNEKAILDYVLNKSGVGIITKKRIYAAHHSINFSYKVSNRQAYSLLQQISSYLKSHKRNRATLILDKYLCLTARNGKYTKQMKRERERFITDFFKITPYQHTGVIPGFAW